ncbi:MAG: hypothetical protein QF444_01685 [Phycisphaerales bacterium]|jgi:hypothetical protein|nr:hypothetical protein [Phycisphaerales bacterium]
MPRRKMTQWFKDSRLSKTKIVSARKCKNWKQLKQAIIVLQRAQKERVSSSKNGRRIQVLEEHEACDAISEDGRYLLRPPLVGRDAANLQESLDKRGFSTVVLCREPKTHFDLCPIVTLGETTTVRTQIEEPANPDKPTAGWFDFAVSELGRTVVDKVDTLATNDRKLDYLLGHLTAISSYDGLYDAIIVICDTLNDSNE